MVIERGDPIRTDYVAYLDSYPGHQSRTVIVGEPSAAQRRDYAINIEVHRATIDRCRAGANRALLVDGLPTQPNLLAAFEAGRRSVEAHERAEGREHSGPQLHAGIAIVEHLKRLERAGP